MTSFYLSIQVMCAETSKTREIEIVQSSLDEVAHGLFLFFSIAQETFISLTCYLVKYSWKISIFYIFISHIYILIFCSHRPLYFWLILLLCWFYCVLVTNYIASLDWGQFRINTCPEIQCWNFHNSAKSSSHSKQQLFIRSGSSCSQT